MFEGILEPPLRSFEKCLAHATAGTGRRSPSALAAFTIFVLFTRVWTSHIHRIASSQKRKSQQFVHLVETSRTTNQMTESLGSWTSWTFRAGLGLVPSAHCFGRGTGRKLRAINCFTQTLQKFIQRTFRSDRLCGQDVRRRVGLNEAQARRLIEEQARFAAGAL